MPEERPALETACVLSVEDNPGDIRLIKEGVDAVGDNIELRQYTNGQQTIDAFVEDDLHPEGIDLVFLDLNLPGKSGLEILQRIRKEQAYDRVPVVVLSSSENPDDIQRVYEESGNAYLTKPVDPDKFIQTIVAAIQFWISTANTDSQK